MSRWLGTPPGRYLLDWERGCFDAAVADVFGYHALQLGMPEIDALRSNRMPHKWIASPSPDAGLAGASRLVTDFSALPFPAASIDLVVLPHALEMNADPHATLREVERVLVPEGRAVICCLNPASLWGLRQRRARLYRAMGMGKLFLPEGGDFLAYWRLRDWLRLLSFEVESGRFGCWRPAFTGETALARSAWMDKAGARWWPIFGAAYMVVAVKRVRGMRLLPAWRESTTMAPAPVAAGASPAGMGSRHHGRRTIRRSTRGRR